MKHLITAALALGLIGGAAIAQDRDGERGRGENHQGGQHGPPPAAPQQAAPRGPSSAQGAPQHFSGPPPFAKGGAPERFAPDRGRPEGDRRDFGRPDSGFRGADRSRVPEPGFRPGGFLRDHGWRGSRFRAPAYRYPPGWNYRYWAFGAFLPNVFLGPDFTIWDYWVFGLPAPPPGYHWIRVGPDALLVRYADGYVLDAAYGLFY